MIVTSFMIRESLILCPCITQYKKCIQTIAAFIFITEDCVDLRFYATGLAGLPPTNYRFISIKSDVIFKFSLGLISLKGHT